MINNIDNNVIDFKSFTTDKTSKDSNNEYVVTLYENRQYKFIVSADSGEDAENIISRQYEEASLDLGEIDIFTYETLAVSKWNIIWQRGSISV